MNMLTEKVDCELVYFDAESGKALVAYSLDDGAYSNAACQRDGG